MISDASHTILLFLGMWMLVYGILLHRASRNNFGHDISYALGGLWLICGSLLPFLITFTR